MKDFCMGIALGIGLGVLCGINSDTIKSLTKNACSTLTSNQKGKKQKNQG